MDKKEKEEILKKAENKHPIGEMEQQKLYTCFWISVLTIGVFAITMMIVEGVLGHISTIYILAAMCFLWAAVFYFLEYFVAKRKFAGIMIGAVLEILAFIFFMVRYILCVLGVWC